MQPTDVLLKNLSTIEHLVTSICRREAMGPEEIEEFASIVKLRLIENDYAILRAFRGRSRFETYLAAVIKRLLIDYRNHQWGKWRSSAEATRLGELAVELERLLYRDGRAFDDAVELMRASHPQVTATELQQVVARLPARTRRRHVALEEAAAARAANVSSAEHAELAARISSVVTEFISGRDESEQLIWRLRFNSDMSVAQIARSLHIEQQALYRRLYRGFDELREKLAAAGISASDVAELVGNDATLLDFDLADRTVPRAESVPPIPNATTDKRR